MSQISLAELHDKAEKALAVVGFTVRENDNGAPFNDPSPGCACLFIQDGEVRLYLTEQPNWENADQAAGTLAGAGLRVVPIGEQPAVSEVRSAYVLLAGTGYLAEGKEPRTGPLGEGWRDQYARLLRSRIRLADAAGPSRLGSAESRDRLFHFFQDVYHLKDWLKNDDDPLLPPKKEIEALFTDAQKSVPVFRLIADLCNGVKHRTLWATSAKTGDHKTTFTRQDVHIGLGGPGGASGSHRWYVTSNGQQLDALDIADEALDAWQQWLAGHRLLS